MNFETGELPAHLPEAGAAATHHLQKSTWHDGQPKHRSGNHTVHKNHVPVASADSHGLKCSKSPDLETFINTAAMNMYDPERLGDLDYIYQYYDCKIKDPQQAATEVSGVMDRTGDTYNHVQFQEEIQRLNDTGAGADSTIGINVRNIYLDKDGKEFAYGPANSVDGSAKDASPAPAADVAAKDTSPTPAADAAAKDAPTSVADVAAKEASPAPEADAAAKDTSPTPVADAAAKDASPGPVAADAAAKDDADSAQKSSLPPISDLPYSRSELVISRVIPGSPAELAGVKKGDVITEVGSESVVGKTSTYVEHLLEGDKDSALDLTVTRDGETLHESMKRDVVNMPVVSEPEDKGDGITYLKIDNFYRNDLPEELEKAMKQNPAATSFIVDIRDNPGGWINGSLNSASMFVDNGVLMQERIRVTSDPARPVYESTIYSVHGNDFITTTQRLGEDDKVVKTVRYPFVSAGRPVAVLINGNSASSSELFAGAVHDSGNATLVGTQSFGKGIGQSFFPDMPGKTQLRLTSLHFMSPSGFWPGDADGHRIGFTPDLYVQNPENARYDSPEDAQLRAAVNLLRSKLALVKHS